MNSIATNIVNIFKDRFSSPPDVFYAPGRINLIGEHIDYNDGYVMPAAIDKGVYFAVAENSTDTINFFAADFNESLSVTLQEIKKLDGWKNYVLSVINEFMLLGKMIKGFDCVLAGDIPIGSGMSSSAAVEAGLAYGLNDIFNLGMSQVELVLLCQRAEHNFPGVNCGIMDMYASINGKEGHVILLDCKNITHEYFPLRLDGCKIVLLNTKVQHTLASGGYNIRRKRCEAGMAILKNELNVQSWRAIKDVAQIDLLKNKVPVEVYNCCRFVVEEIGRTKKAAALLQQNDLHGFGQLMYATHWGLSKLYDVSCPESDFLVELAATSKSVIGARQMGGGFGGCTINIVKDEAIEDFIAQANTAYKKQFNIQTEAYVMALSNGAHKILSKKKVSADKNN
jgi:galactokinase